MPRPSRVCRRFGELVASLILLCAILPHCAKPVVQAEQRTINISYKELIDGSQLTHSGETLGEVINQIRGATATDASVISQRLLIEPFLEPYSFLLEDALQTLYPNKVKQGLYELGSLFPPGESQPAWADLVRTRRYCVLTDAKGSVRIFVPASSSAEGYRKHFGALRQILMWTSRSQSQTRLEVEVFGYENDLAAQSLKLHLPSHKLVFDSNLRTSDHGSGLDLNAIARFLARPVTLEGASLYDGDKLILYGAISSKPMTLAGQQVSLADLAVIYRAVFHSGSARPYASLDPGPYPEEVIVNFGCRLQDTLAGWVALQSDLRLKTISVNLDPSTGQDISDNIRSQIPGFLSKTERWLAAPQDEVPLSKETREETRYWFYPDLTRIALSADRNHMRISSARFLATGERIARRSTQQTAPLPLPSWTRDALTHLNDNYDGYARLFPELQELDTLGRLFALFAWLKERKDAGELNIDLDTLLSAELPRFSTPRHKTQMIVGFFQSSGGKQRAYDYSWVSEELATARRGGDLKLRSLLPTNVAQLRSFVPTESVAQVIIGGVELDHRDAVASAGRLSQAELNLYRKLAETPSERTITEPATGRAWLRSKNELAVESHAGAATVVLKPGLVKTQAAGEELLSIEPIDKAGQQVSVLKQQNGKLRFVRNGPSDPLGDKNSATVSMNEDGSISGFVRYEAGSRLSYRLANTPDGLAAEPMVNDVRYLPQDIALAISAIKENASIEQAWRNLPEDTNIAAIDRTPDGTIVVLRRVGAEYQLLRQEGEQLVIQSSGPDAFRRLNEMARETVKRESTRTVSFVHASLQGDDVILQVGASQKSVPVKDLERLLREPRASGISSLDELLNGTDGGTELIVYRDSTTRRPVRFGGSLKEESADNPIRLAAMLRERYPNKKVFVDDELVMAKRNLQSIRMIRRKADVGVLIPENSFPVIDHGLIDRIRDHLKINGIQVFGTGDGIRGFETRAGGTPLPNLLMISGHNNEALIDYLDALGEKGILKDKVVILNTCYSKANSNLAHRLISKHGARAIRLYVENIRPVAIEAVMREVSAMLAEAEQAAVSIHPDDLIEKAADRLLRNTKPSSNLRRELEKLKRGFLQISESRRSSESNDVLNGE